MSFRSSPTQATVLFIAYLLCHQILSQEYADAECVGNFWDTFSRGETVLNTVTGTTAQDPDDFVVTPYPAVIAGSEQVVEFAAVAVLPGVCNEFIESCFFIAYTIAGSDTVFLGNFYFVTTEESEILPIGELPLTDVTSMDFDCNGVLYVVNSAGVVYSVTLAEDGSIESTSAVATAEESCSADMCTELIAYDYDEEEFIRISAPTDPTSGADALICEGVEAEECEVIADPNGYCPSSAINGVSYIGNGLAAAVCTMGDGTTNHVLLDTEEGEFIEFADGFGFFNTNITSGPLMIGIQEGVIFDWCGAQNCDEDDDSDSDSDSESDSESDSDSADNAMMEMAVTADYDLLMKEMDDTHYTIELTLSGGFIHMAWATTAIFTAVCLTAACFSYRNKKAQVV